MFSFLSPGVSKNVFQILLCAIRSFPTASRSSGAWMGVTNSLAGSTASSHFCPCHPSTGPHWGRGGTCFLSCLSANPPGAPAGCRAGNAPVGTCRRCGEGCVVPVARTPHPQCLLLFGENPVRTTKHPDSSPHWSAQLQSVLINLSQGRSRYNPLCPLVFLGEATAPAVADKVSL